MNPKLNFAVALFAMRNSIPIPLRESQGEVAKAHVAELADAYGSGPYGETRGGSSPLVSTISVNAVVVRAQTGWHGEPFIGHDERFREASAALLFFLMENYFI